MPRPRRFHVPGGIYHVTLRGNHRARIFHRENDFRLIECLLGEACFDYGLQVHAYCWMPNHIHVAIAVSDHPLARPMQKLASVYARRVQSAQLTTGHLFERRYHAVLVDSERYLFALVRYIHLNPVRAGLVRTPGDYLWSSHLAYLEGSKPEWLRCDSVLRLLASDPDAARRAYRQFMQETPPTEELDYLRGKTGRDTPDDGMPRRPGLPSSVSNASISLDDLIRQECAYLDLEPASLLKPGSGRRHALARARITARATSLGLATLGQLALRLGRSPSSLSEGLRRARQNHPLDFVKSKSAPTGQSESGGSVPEKPETRNSGTV